MLSDGTHLHYPNDAHQLENGYLLITDRNNNRCVIVDKDGSVVWYYNHELKHPHNCDALPNGNILIADSDGKRVIEVNRNKDIVWQYGGGREQLLDWPRDADRLGNGNTLITDSRNNRVIEVTPDGRIVWCFKVPYFANFYDSDKLTNGNVLISDQQHHQILEVDLYGNVVWLYRNFRNKSNINAIIKNGSFRKRDINNLPENWILFNRFSEGGGRIIWDEGSSSYPCPGLELDRQGALCLQQLVSVNPGFVYRMGGRVRTAHLKDGSFAFLQMAFRDCMGGLIEDASRAPKGRLFAGDNDWVEDSFEAIAPEGACSVELRFTISGPGSAWVKNIMFLGM
jgi:hypothetical protein